MTNTKRPQQIAGFEILDILGEGGMGVVYLAQQHEPVSRRIALKVIKLGMDSEQVLARFDAERQAIALMNHDCIAKVFEAGATPEGQPFFVMEHVEGLPITDYCDRKKSSLRERLRLFQKVCAGVQHAHTKGMIHRDLKPSNIMITEYDGKATPKIIDFGLARATDQDLDPNTLLTEYGQIIGTPEYSSPEQLDLIAAAVDTRTDVYALGVLLHELLIGQLPLERPSSSAGLVEFFRQLRDEEPARPSSRLLKKGTELITMAEQRRSTPAAIAREVRGDLDGIVLRAMNRDPEQRYDSASALAEDVERFLRYEPVRAQPPSTMYQLRKFVRRNRSRLIAVATVFVSLIAGIIAFAIESHRAQVNEGRAVESRDRAIRRLDFAMDALETYFTGVTEDVLLKQPEFEDLRNRLLTAPRDIYERLSRDLEQDPDLKPEVKARLAEAYRQLGAVTADVGSAEAGLAAFERALAILRELARQTKTASLRYQLNDVLLATGAQHFRAGNSDQAEKTYKEALDVLQQVIPTNDITRLKQREAATQDALGRLYLTSGRFEEAESALSKAENIRMALVGEDSDSAIWKRELANTRDELADLYLRTKNSKAAKAQAEAAVAARDELLQDRAGDLGLRIEAANSYEILGGILIEARELPVAYSIYERALQIRQSIAEEFPVVGHYQHRVASNQTMLGVVHTYENRHTDAEPRFRTALALMRPLFGQRPDYYDYRRTLGQVLLNLGLLHGRKNEHEKAVETLQESVKVHEKLFEEFPRLIEIRRQLATTHNNLATSMQALGRLQDARKAYEHTRDVLEWFVNEHPNVAMYKARLGATHYNIAQLAERLQDDAVAISNYESTLAALRSALETDPNQGLANYVIPLAQRGRAEMLTHLGRYDDALTEWSQAIEGTGDPEVELQLQLRRCVTIAKQGRHAEAARTVETLLSGAETSDSWYVAATALAQAAATVLNQAHEQSPHDARLAATYRGAAISHLEEAETRGAFQNPHRRQHLKKDRFLDPLRSEQEFQDLLQQILNSE